MLDLRALPFTDNAKDKIRTQVNNHYQLAGIEITGGPKSDAEGAVFLDVQVSQRHIKEGKVLSDDELVSRCAGIFDGQLPEGFRIQIWVKPHDK